MRITWSQCGNRINFSLYKDIKISYKSSFTNKAGKFKMAENVADSLICMKLLFEDVFCGDQQETCFGFAVAYYIKKFQSKNESKHFKL